MLRRLWPWRVPLVLGLASAAASLPGWTSLRWDRSAIAAGEAWRLVSGHAAHLGPRHFAANLAGLILLWVLVGSATGPAAWLFVILVTVAFIDLGLWWLEPQLAWYVGLSGLLHGMLAAGVLLRFDGTDRVLGLLLLAKLAWEQFAGPLSGSLTSPEGNVVVNAHLYGALGGAAAAFVLRMAPGLRRRYRAQTPERQTRE